MPWDIARLTPYQLRMLVCDKDAFEGKFTIPKHKVREYVEWKRKQEEINQCQ